MLIDTHCHIDQYPEPERMVRECEQHGVRVVAVTYFPTNFGIAADKLRGHPLISAALGMHPLFASKAIRQLSAFKRMAPFADFIGEVGLDFSPQGISSRALQERVFDEVVQTICDRQRFVTLHSRRAEKTVLDKLSEFEVKRVVFHWFSGTSAQLRRVLDAGHLVSINPAMLHSSSGKEVLSFAPPEQVLVESDGPFARVGDEPCRPTGLSAVYQALATMWKLKEEAVAERIKRTFEELLRLVELEKTSTGEGSR